MKKIVFLLAMLVMLVGCGNKEQEETKPTVTDESVIETITGNVYSLANIPKTAELYKNKSFKVGDYASDDIILYGLTTAYGLEENNSLTAEEIQALATRNITNVTSKITTADVDANIANVFGPKDIQPAAKYGDCPSYVYDDTNKLYYVNETCTANKDLIISYVDEITYDGNNYYATVYYGYEVDNKIYSDVNKTKVVAELSDDQGYEIDDKNKSNFTKYTYTFTKNSSANYIFTSAESK